MFRHVIIGYGARKELGINMNKYRGAWYEPYKIVTTLTREETERRLGSIDGKFQISSRMWNLPSNWELFFLPKIVGEIIEVEDGTSIVLMRIKVSITDLLLAFVAYTCLCFFMQISVLIYAPILWLAVILIIIYWKSARNRFGKRLEMLLKAEIQ